MELGKHFLINVIFHQWRTVSSGRALGSMILGCISVSWILGKYAVLTLMRSWLHVACQICLLGFPPTPLSEGQWKAALPQMPWHGWQDGSSKVMGLVNEVISPLVPKTLLVSEFVEELWSEANRRDQKTALARFTLIANRPASILPGLIYLPLLLMVGHKCHIAHGPTPLCSELVIKWVLNCELFL